MLRIFRVNKCAVIPFGNFHTEQMQLQDNSFGYTVNPPHNVKGSLPPTSIADYDNTVITDELAHPSKRRKFSNSNTQDTLLKGPEESVSSYNFFASPDPNGPPQTATSLPPVPFTEGNDGTPQDVETEPLPMGTPPPTIPFSEDLPQEPEASVAKVKTAGYEAQETILQQLPSETENEFLSTKKKRGRPKKQENPATAYGETKIVIENPSEVLEQPATKKKPGRPKKQEADTANDQLPVDSLGDHINEAETTELGTKSSKKKVKRSKTTSDMPITKSDELVAEPDVIWIETNPIDFATTADGQMNITELAASAEEVKLPKKRGRKKKEVVQEADPSTENQAVLQDISNIQQQTAQQEKHKDNDVEMDSTKQKVADGVNTSNATKICETPTVEIQSKDNKQAEAVEIATPTQEKNKSLRQTPISSAGRVPFRVGLSRRAQIAPLLKFVRK